MTKRILSFILALFLTTSLSAPAYAAEVDTTEDTNNLSVVESSSSTEVTEPVLTAQTAEAQKNDRIIC